MRAKGAALKLQDGRGLSHTGEAKLTHSLVFVYLC